MPARWEIHHKDDKYGGELMGIMPDREAALNVAKNVMREFPCTSDEILLRHIDEFEFAQDYTFEEAQNETAPD